MQEAALDEEVLFWIITDDDYSQLRRIEGCEMMSDIGRTKSEAVLIHKLAQKFGASDSRIIHDKASSFD